MKELLQIKKAIPLINHSIKTVALTGAGISVDSGIHPFRGKNGLWEKYDPYEYAHITSFLKNPNRSWIMLKEMGEQIFAAKPNPAHTSLTYLQKKGKLDTIITQNVDNLHQEAGNVNVIEYHGNYNKLTCLACGLQFPFNQKKISEIPPPPKCTCGRVLKPNIVLFGESPPKIAIDNSQKVVKTCHTLLIIGTSAMVYPAANLPYIAKKNQANIIEINKEPSSYTTTLSNIFIKGNAGKILGYIAEKI